MPFYLHNQAEKNALLLASLAVVNMLTEIRHIKLSKVSISHKYFVYITLFTAQFPSLKNHANCNLYELTIFRE